MNENYDELDIITTGAYLKGDYTSLSDYERTQIYNNLDLIKDHIDSPENLRRVCIKIFDYYNNNLPLFVLFIRILTENRIQLNYSEVPEYKNVVLKLSDLVRKSRILF